jgi:hypothetical protein
MDARVLGPYFRRRHGSVVSSGLGGVVVGCCGERRGSERGAKGERGEKLFRARESKLSDWPLYANGQALRKSGQAGKVTVRDSASKRCGTTLEASNPSFKFRGRLCQIRPALSCPRRRDAMSCWAPHVLERSCDVWIFGAGLRLSALNRSLARLGSCNRNDVAYESESEIRRV